MAKFIALILFSLLLFSNAPAQDYSSFDHPSYNLCMDYHYYDTEIISPDGEVLYSGKLLADFGGVIRLLVSKDPIRYRDIPKGTVKYIEANKSEQKLWIYRE